MLRPRKFSDTIQDISRHQARAPIAVTRNGTKDARKDLVTNLLCNIHRQVVPRVANRVRINANHARLVRRKVAKAQGRHRHTSQGIRVTTGLRTGLNMQRHTDCSANRVARHREFNGAPRAPRASQVLNVQVVSKRRQALVRRARRIDHDRTSTAVHHVNVHVPRPRHASNGVRLARGLAARARSQRHVGKARRRQVVTGRRVGAANGHLVGRHREKVDHGDSATRELARVARSGAELVPLLHVTGQVRHFRRVRGLLRHYRRSSLYRYSAARVHGARRARCHVDTQRTTGPGRCP